MKLPLHRRVRLGVEGKNGLREFCERIGGVGSGSGAPRTGIEVEVENGIARSGGPGVVLSAGVGVGAVTCITAVLGVVVS